jgi:NTE family protein
LTLQGGGALGAYQAGVYQALDEAGIHPDWIAGISIGAINAAIIAGNPPKLRVARLREFWTMATANPIWGMLADYAGHLAEGIDARRAINQASAQTAALAGVPGFFALRPLPPFLAKPASAAATSWYDTTRLRNTLSRLVDFDCINAGTTRLSVGAVNIESGNFVYFDTTTHKIGPAHIMASGALPPSFPAIEIDGQYYWDGGTISNTPLQWVLDARPRLDTLAFQIDLWSAQGELPRDLTEAEVREKEIRFSSRTRASTDQYKKMQKLRIAFEKLLKQLPDKLRGLPEVKMLAAEADDKVCNIVHLIYHSKKFEGCAKDYEFSRRTMEEHWKAGHDDAVRALSHPEVFQCPNKLEGVRTFDFSHHGQKQDRPNE